MNHYIIIALQWSALKVWQKHVLQAAALNYKLELETAYIIARAKDRKNPDF